MLICCAALVCLASASNAKFDFEGAFKTIQDSMADLKEYNLNGRDYNKIQNEHLREVVEGLCHTGCNRASCKNDFIKKECDAICPKQDIKHCLSGKFW